MGNLAFLVSVALAITGLVWLQDPDTDQPADVTPSPDTLSSVEAARELAMAGRKLVLTDWAENYGVRMAPPFSDFERAGGRLIVDAYSAGNQTLDFTVRASYDTIEYEVHSRFRWLRVLSDSADTDSEPLAAEIDGRYVEHVGTWHRVIQAQELPAQFFEVAQQVER